MGHLKTFTKGVLLGGLVGIIYGLFNAPKKGSELKKEFAPKLRKAMMGAKKVEKKALSKGKKIVNKVRATAKKYKKGNPLSPKLPALTNLRGTGRRTGKK